MWIEVSVRHIWVDSLISLGADGKKKTMPKNNDAGNRSKEKDQKDKDHKDKTSKTSDKKGKRKSDKDRRPRLDIESEQLLDGPLGGFIFVCNDETMEEDFSKKLFGLPTRFGYRSLVKLEKYT